MHGRIRLATLLAILSSPVLAQQAANIRIEAQDMPSALHSLASQAGIQLLFDADDLKGARTNGLRGTFSGDEALRRLLDGSRFGFKVTGKNAYVIHPLPKPTASRPDAVLSEVLVTASTRTPNPLDRTPASISLVEREDFEETQAATVSQVMKKLPNVEFGGGPRVNGEIPAIRGITGPSITLLVDGARQNDTTSPGLKSPLFIDPYFLQRAEVVRGASSSLYGSGGVGGVMAFSTYSARDLLEAGRSVGGGARLAYSDADRSTRLNARLYGGNDTIDGLVAVGLSDWNKIRQGGGRHLDPNDGDASTGLAKIGIRPTPDSRIELSHQFYSSDNLQVNNAQATQYRTANLPITMPAVQKVHVDQFTTMLKGRIGDVDGAPALSASLYKTGLKYVFDRSPDPTITNVLYSDTETETVGGSLQGSRIFDGGGWGRHRVTAGFDTFEDRQSAVAATAANPSAPSTVTRDGTRRASGWFVQDEIAFGGGWRLTPSLRADRYSASLAGGSLPDNSESRVSPKVSLSWTEGGLMLFGNAGEAFRAPTVVELYQNFAGFGLTNFLPNASLRPEIDRSLELGANYAGRHLLSEGDSLKVRASWFGSRVTDLIHSVNLGGMTPSGSTPAQQAGFAANCAATGLNCKLQYQNVPDARRTGGEISVDYRLGQWQFNAAYSRVRVENRDDGDRLFSPPDKIVVQIRRQLPAQNMTVLWNSTGVAAQDYDSTVLRRRSGYATHDVFLSWAPPGWKARLDVGVANLFDRRYSAYQSGNAYAYTYQEGRSLKLSLGADF
ncbi:MAG: TonB-dependent receptor [Rhodocyclaceae bacterium]|nr:TonB-dependent receptor [Rhodocyclaceae bacterium]